MPWLYGQTNAYGVRRGDGREAIFQHAADRHAFIEGIVTA